MCDVPEVRDKEDASYTENANKARADANETEDAENAINDESMTCIAGRRPRSETRKAERSQVMPVKPFVERMTSGQITTSIADRRTS